MAYAYDKTMKALGLTGDDEGVTTGTSPSDSLSLTSSEGDLSSGGQGSSGGAPAQAPAQQSSTNSARAKVMQKNAGKSQAPADLGKFQSQVQNARAGIQNEANAYLESADDPYEASRDQIQGKIKEYASGNQKDTSWLAAAKTAPSMMPGINLKTDTTVKDIDLLQNDSGIQQLFRRGQDAEGTVGEAALDTALLRKNQPFQLTRDALMGDYKNLQSEKNKLIQETPEKAQALRNTAYDTYKKNIEELANQELGTYDQKARASEADFLAKMEQEEAARRGNLSADADQVRMQIIKDHPEMAPYLSLPDNLDSYYTPNYRTPTIGAVDDGWMDFVSGEDAAGFNRIMEILGGGDTRLAGSMAGRDPRSALIGGLNKDKLVQDLMSGASDKKKRAEQAKAAEAERARQQKEEAQARWDKMSQEQDANIASKEKGAGKDDYYDVFGDIADPLTGVMRRATGERLPITPGDAASKSLRTVGKKLRW